MTPAKSFAQFRAEVVQGVSPQGPIDLEQEDADDIEEHDEATDKSLQQQVEDIEAQISYLQKIPGNGASTAQLREQLQFEANALRGKIRAGWPEWKTRQRQHKQLVQAKRRETLLAEQ